MKRLVIRLGILSVVVALGLLAIAQAPRAARVTKSAEPEQPEAEKSDVRQKLPRPIPHVEEAALPANPFTASRLIPGKSAPQQEPTVVRGNDEGPPAKLIQPDAAEGALAARPLRPVSHDHAASAANEALPVADPFSIRGRSNNGPRPVSTAAEDVPPPADRFARPASSGSRFSPVGNAQNPPAKLSRVKTINDTSVIQPGTGAAAPLGRAALTRRPAAATLLQEITTSNPPVKIPSRGSHQLAPLSSAENERLDGEGSGRPGAKNLEGPQTPSLVVEKTAPAEIQVGKPATFQVKIRNVGRIAAHEILVRDQVPQGTRLIDTSPESIREADGSVLWQLGSLKPGGEVVVAMQLEPLTEGDIGSVATVVFQSQASVKTLATRPQLVLEHTAPRKVLVGDEFKLVIQLSNPGTGAATGVVLEEDVPEQFAHPAGQQLEFEVGTLQPGETRQLVLTLKAAKAGAIKNVLVARAEGNLRVEDPAPIEVIAPQLAVAVSGPSKRYLERKATYTVLVANPGTAAAKNVELVAYLPKGLKFLKTVNQGQYDSARHAVHWNLEELPPQETGKVQFTVMPIEAGQLKIRVEGKAQMGLADVREQTLIVEGLAALLFEVADTADPIEVGKRTTYEVRLVNQGSKSSTNIRLVAVLPREMKAVSGEGPTRAVIDGQRIVFEPLVRLSPKADALYKIHVVGLRPGDQRVSIQLQSDEMTTPVTKEEATRVYADDQ